jgi:hypothetical protein
MKGTSPISKIAVHAVPVGERDTLEVIVTRLLNATCSVKIDLHNASYVDHNPTPSLHLSPSVFAPLRIRCLRRTERAQPLLRS